MHDRQRIAVPRSSLIAICQRFAAPVRTGASQLQQSVCSAVFLGIVYNGRETAIDDTLARESPIQTPLNGPPAEPVADGVQCGVETLLLRMGFGWALVEQAFLRPQLCLVPAGDPHPDQAHRPACPGFGLDEPPGGAEDLDVIRGRLLERARAGMGLEGPEADLQSDHQAFTMLVPRQMADLLRRPAQGVLEDSGVGDVLTEGGLLGDRFAV